MSREELDRLNAEGKSWRDRNKSLQTQHIVNRDTSSEDVAETEKEGSVLEFAPMPKIQMDLWEKE